MRGAGRSLAESGLTRFGSHNRGAAVKASFHGLPSGERSQKNLSKYLDIFRCLPGEAPGRPPTGRPRRMSDGQGSKAAHPFQTGLFRRFKFGRGPFVFVRFVRLHQAGGAQGLKTAKPGRLMRYRASVIGLLLQIRSVRRSWKAVRRRPCLLQWLRDRPRRRRRRLPCRSQCRNGAFRSRRNCCRRRSGSRSS